MFTCLPTVKREKRALNTGGINKLRVIVLGDKQDIWQRRSEPLETIQILKFRFRNDSDLVAWSYQTLVLHLICTESGRSPLTNVNSLEGKCRVGV